MGLFNLGEAEAKLTLARDDLLIVGARRIRDLLENADEGLCDDSFAALAPPHGVKLVRVFDSARPAERRPYRGQGATGGAEPGGFGPGARED